jgi:2-polyprenyl-6-methoxyphenol hydroxylase-like FAD-dependent oxidoreductase
MSAIVGKRIAIVRRGGPGGLTLARLLQQSGAQVSVYERDLRTFPGTGHLAGMIDRAGSLRDLLLDSLQLNTVQWDCKLESAELQGEQVLLRFAGGQIALADIAVGCDGANSRLRELVTSIRPEYVGVSLVVVLIPSSQKISHTYAVFRLSQS